MAIAVILESPKTQQLAVELAMNCRSMAAHWPLIGRSMALASPIEDQTWLLAWSGLGLKPAHWSVWVLGQVTQRRISP
jgi:hypothetical protein